MPYDPDDEWHYVEPTETPDPHHAVKRWEKLRLVYNAILVPWSIFLIAVLPESPLWPLELFVGGFLANVCFCIGPVAETYLVWIGANAQIARGWLFALGTAFTALAAFATLAN